MTTWTTAVARRLFDGFAWHENAALEICDGRVTGVIPGAVAEVDLIVPGLVDLQVNGGGGVQFNNQPTAQSLAEICAAHRALGTTSIMATLITDTAQVTAQALEAWTDVPGLAGLHLEGPHLDPRRKGTHDPALIRPMAEADLARILSAAHKGPLMVTLAPESGTPEQVAQLVAAGVTVSLGHSDCEADTAFAYFRAGASMVTHLFNAMSQMGHRAPGLVGAALDADVTCGLIADGHHVSDTAMRVALKAKPGRVFLVSDAMAVTGSDLDRFTLNGRTIYRAEGRLTLADGTLAGADVTMLEALRTCVTRLDVALGDALAMATCIPAEAAGLSDVGRLTEGARADYLVLGDDLTLQEVHTGEGAT